MSLFKKYSLFTVGSLEMKGKLHISYSKRKEQGRTHNLNQSKPRI